MAHHQQVHHRDRVPVDRRFAGLDRRSLAPALVVVGIWLLWAVVVPHLNEAITYDDQAGVAEQLALTEDLAVTAPDGWQVVTGFRTDDLPAGGPDGQVVVSNGTVTVAVVADDFSGTPDELLDQIDRVTTATGAQKGYSVGRGRETVTTDSGLKGVSESYTSPAAEGRVAAFVVDGTGIEVQVASRPGEETNSASEVDRLIASIGPRNPDQQEAP